jgi:hypothetical protein
LLARCRHFLGLRNPGTRPPLLLLSRLLQSQGLPSGQSSPPHLMLLNTACTVRFHKLYARFELAATFFDAHPGSTAGCAALHTVLLQGVPHMTQVPAANCSLSRNRGPEHILTTHTNAGRNETQPAPPRLACCQDLEGESSKQARCNGVTVMQCRIHYRACQHCGTSDEASGSYAAHVDCQVCTKCVTAVTVAQQCSASKDRTVCQCCGVYGLLRYINWCP